MATGVNSYHQPFDLQISPDTKGGPTVYTLNGNQPLSPDLSKANATASGTLSSSSSSSSISSSFSSPISSYYPPASTPSNSVSPQDEEPKEKEKNCWDKVTNYFYDCFSKRKQS